MNRAKGPDVLEESFFRKASQDPYYRHLVGEPDAREQLLLAGFFDDRLATPVQQHPSWIRPDAGASLHKILEPWRHATRSSAGQVASARNVVLLSTGSFSPVHRGHLAMMDVARKRCEEQGWNVLGGFLSASHDGYVAFKQGGRAALPAEYRLALLEAAVSDSPWLSVCPWEARHSPTNLNFTDVIERLKGHIKKGLAPLSAQPDAVDVVYVFGSDNAGFLRAFEHQGFAVCVMRPGADQAPKLAAPQRCLLAQAHVEASSSQVREGRADLLPPALARLRQVAFERDSKRAAQRPLRYLVRDDLSYGTQHWRGIPAEARASFVTDLVSILKEGLDSSKVETAPCGEGNDWVRAALTPPAGLEVAVLSLERQHEQLRHTWEQILTRHPEAKLVSLDVATPADAALHLSRAFVLSDGQVRSEGHVARPGYSCVSRQIEDIERTLRAANGIRGHNPYWLVDDDLATGATLEKVKALLTPAVGAPQGVLFLNQLLEGASDRAEGMHDIVDARDFLLGALNAGLTCDQGGQQFVRAPYAMPFVNLTYRAKLLPTALAPVSKAVWALNSRWFARWAPHLALTDTHEATQRLWVSRGFRPDCLLVAVAQAMTEAC